MNIKVNGAEKRSEAKNLAELAAELGLPDKGVAMAVDGKMVKRPEWEGKELQEGAAILIIRASCGG